MDKTQHSSIMLLALGAMVWGLSVGAHELLGHGGVCWIDPGCDWAYADAMYFAGTRQEGPWSLLQISGGSLFIILMSMVAAWVLHHKRPQDSSLYVFIWLFMVMGFFHEGSYIAFGWLIHDGMDWARIAHSLENPETGNIAVSAAGLFVICIGFLAARKLMPQPTEKLSLPYKIRLLGLPYIASIVVAVSASLLVPGEDRFFLIMGGIGTSLTFMIWMPLAALLPGPKENANLVRGAMPYNVFLLLLSIAIAGIYVLILGPGITFR